MHENTSPLITKFKFKNIFVFIKYCIVVAKFHSLLVEMTSFATNASSLQDVSLSKCYKRLPNDERVLFDEIIFECGIPNAYKSVNSTDKILGYMERMIGLVQNNNDARDNLKEFLLMCKSSPNFKTNFISNRMQKFKDLLCKEVLVSILLNEDEDSQQGNYQFRSLQSDPNVHLTNIELNVIYSIVRYSRDLHDLEEKINKGEINEV